MRKWEYEYKASDGSRLVGEMEAPAKDDVYAEVRRRGIRPIRVTERIVPVVRKGLGGLRTRDWLLIGGGVVLILAVGVFFAVGVAHKKFVGETGQGDVAAGQTGRTTSVPATAHPVAQRIADQVEQSMVKFREDMGGVDTALLSNYALIEHSDDMKLFELEIARARETVRRGRDSVREIYVQQYARVPADRVKDQQAVQNVYGIVMDEIDTAAERLEGVECLIGLLVSNRGKWKAVRGDVVWEDSRLEREFQLFKRVSQPTVERWELRDEKVIGSQLTTDSRK